MFKIGDRVTCLTQCAIGGVLIESVGIGKVADISRTRVLVNWGSYSLVHLPHELVLYVSPLAVYRNRELDVREAREFVAKLLDEPKIRAYLFSDNQDKRIAHVVKEVLNGYLLEIDEVRAAFKLYDKIMDPKAAEKADLISKLKAQLAELED